MRISSLHVYPVKGLRGISVSSAKVEVEGLQFDRRWMIVDEDRRFLSQRELPAMARIDCEISDELLHMSTPEFGTCSFPVGMRGEKGEATVWSSLCEVEYLGELVDVWISEVLERPVRLVRLTGDRVRQREDTEADFTVSFADGYPILVVGTASLQSLNQRLDDPIPMNRFRPNIVIESNEPFVEETWKLASGDEVELSFVRRCGRCLVITTDQETGQRSPEPLQALASYRLFDQKATFGMNVIPTRPGTLRVGEELKPRV